MPKYKAIYTEYHRVAVIFTEEFDTADKDKWEWLKSSVEYEMDSDDFEALPLMPPKDPQIWFSLFQQLSEMEYGEREDDWITLRKGGYDTSRELIDSKGKVIDSM